MLLLQGTAVKSSGVLASVSVAFPFLCATLGGSLVVAGMLLPLFMAGGLIGGAIAPPIMASRGSSRSWLISTSMLTAAVITTVGLVGVVPDVGAVTISAVFAFAAVAVGMAGGIGGIAYSDLLGTKVPQDRRSSLLFTRSAAGGALTIGAAVITARLFVGHDALIGHLTLEWVAAVFLGISALLCTIFLSRSTFGAPTQLNLGESLRRGAHAARAFPWFRRFLVTQVLLLSVTLGTSFYSIHAASVHGHEAATLSVLVCFAGVGLVLGAFAWERILNRYGYRRMFILGAMASVVAALLSAAIHVAGWHVIWFHGIVVLLATMSAEAVTIGRRAYLIDNTSNENRPVLLSFALIVVTVSTGLLAALLGSLAEIQGPVWPVLVLVGLNFVAVGGALLSPRSTVKGVTRESTPTVNDPAD
jgi:MFS family permease